VYGYNIGPGSNSLFSCSTAVVPDGSPFGSFEGVDIVGTSVTASGWAIDPNVTDPIPVHLYVDGVGRAVLADQPRTDVGNAYAAYGPSHGWSSTFELSRGSHQICAYGYNVGPGKNTLLSCRTVQVTVTGDDNGRSPIGNFEGISGALNELTISGWTLDPDTSASAAVHVYIDGVGYQRLADKARYDVATAYSGYGPSHGFVETFPASPGSHEVCVYGINTGRGAHSGLGCRTVTVLASPPVGSLDVVAGVSGGVQVSGWVATPNSRSSIAAHVYVNGAGVAIDATNPRPDVQAAIPGVGPNTGFDRLISAPSGAAEVCVYAVDWPNQVQSSLGCRQIRIP
jgi:hypothetical protein